jgi:hypothetical protein
MKHVRVPVFHDSLMKQHAWRSPAMFESATCRLVLAAACAGVMWL